MPWPVSTVTLAILDPSLRLSMAALSTKHREGHVSRLSGRVSEVPLQCHALDSVSQDCGSSAIGGHATDLLLGSRRGSAAALAALGPSHVPFTRSRTRRDSPFLALHMLPLGDLARAATGQSGTNCFLSSTPWIEGVLSGGRCPDPPPRRRWSDHRPRSAPLDRSGAAWYSSIFRSRQGSPCG